MILSTLNPPPFTTTPNLDLCGSPGRGQGGGRGGGGEFAVRHHGELHRLGDPGRSPGGGQREGVSSRGRHQASRRSVRRGGGNWRRRKFGARLEGGCGGVGFLDGAAQVRIAGRPLSPQGGGAGCGRRLDALSRQGPGPRQLCAQILREEQGAGLTPGGTCNSPLIPERKWGRGRRELGGRTRTQQVPGSTSQPILPPRPTHSCSLPGSQASSLPRLRQARSEGHFLCMASAAEPHPLAKHPSAQLGGP